VLLGYLLQQPRFHSKQQQRWKLLEDLYLESFRTGDLRYQALKQIQLDIYILTGRSKVILTLDSSGNHRECFGTANGSGFAHIRANVNKTVLEGLHHVFNEGWYSTA
jgi:hypothetical protein